MTGIKAETMGAEMQAFTIHAANQVHPRTPEPRVLQHSSVHMVLGNWGVIASIDWTVSSFSPII